MLAPGEVLQHLSAQLGRRRAALAVLGPRSCGGGAAIAAIALVVGWGGGHFQEANKRASVCSHSPIMQARCPKFRVIDR